MAVELARDTLRAHFQKIDLPVALIGILSLAETLLFTANVALDFNGDFSWGGGYKKAFRCLFSLQFLLRFIKSSITTFRT